MSTALSMHDCASQASPPVGPCCQLQQLILRVRGPSRCMRCAGSMWWQRLGGGRGADSQDRGVGA